MRLYVSLVVVGNDAFREAIVLAVSEPLFSSGIKKLRLFGEHPQEVSCSVASKSS